MLELSPYRKNKINLEDYDYKQDIKNRVIMSRFSEREKEILEEILYSPPKITIEDLASSLDLEESEINGCLQNLMECNLFHIDNDTLVMNKDVRKYFESHSIKFEEDFFVPNMEFLQALLKKVPIHVLPNWYHIPRTSNNIFDSLVEKYLQTPQIFQRYLKELNLGDPVLDGIVEDVYSSPDFKVSSEFLRNKYNLERDQFEEYILHLEFNFVCCLGSEKKGGQWEEIVTPFFEWRQYLLFLQKTTPATIENEADIKLYRPTEYAFADDMADLLTKSIENPISLSECTPYFQRVAKKSSSLNFSEIIDGKLHILPDGESWIKLPPDDRALQLFKHPLNEISLSTFPEELSNKKNVRETEKSVKRLINCGWVLLEDFLNGMTLSFSEENQITLQKLGKQWNYKLPEYTEEERVFMSHILLNWLFEGGVLMKGELNGKECIKLTGIGKALFQ